MNFVPFFFLVYCMEVKAWTYVTIDTDVCCIWCYADLYTIQPIVKLYSTGSTFENLCWRIKYEHGLRSCTKERSALKTDKQQVFKIKHGVQPLICCVDVSKVDYISVNVTSMPAEREQITSQWTITQPSKIVRIFHVICYLVGRDRILQSHFNQRGIFWYHSRV